MRFSATRTERLRRFVIRPLLLALSILALQTSVSVAAQSCTPPQGFPNPALFSAMQRGVNLPGWDDADPARHPTLPQLQALREHGFTHIRLPLDSRRLDGPAGSDYVGNIYEEAILLLSLGYAVSLDLHAGEEVGQQFSDNPQTGYEYLKKLWTKLVPMVRGLDPEKVAIELLNEPVIDQETWMSASTRLIGVLRAALPKHTIVVGPSGPQRYEMLSGMTPFDDANVVYAVHYYDPFFFTHQGANWGAPDDPLRFLANLRFPASRRDASIVRALEELKETGRGDVAAQLRQSLDQPWDEKGIAEAFDIMARWSQDHGRPVIINEFGVLSFTAPRESRLGWLAMVNRLARQRCLGWTHWDFQDGFGLMDPLTGLPDSEIMRSLQDAD